jgi:hypothetical protein
MRIMHRVAFAATPAEEKQLDDLGIKLTTVTAMPGGGDPFIAFDIREDDPVWPPLRSLLHRWGRSEGNVSTSFTKKELDSARWLELGAWHHGYPQPDEDVFGYRQATYDLTDWCGSCGIGKKQKAPFQMKGEPKWGKRSILQLNWVFDAYFVTPDAWALVFKPHGIECRPVLNTKGGELRSVVQLVAQGEVGVVREGLATEEAACSSCGRTKYLPVARGRFPAMKEEPSTAMVTTKECFGSGASAHRRVLVSQAVAHSLTAAKLRGASMRPVADRETGS